MTRPLRQCVAAACKGDASLESGRHHYMVNTRGDRWRDGHADDRLVKSLYYPPHENRWHQRNRSKNVALIMPSAAEVQSKVDLLSAPSTTVAEAAVQAEHRLNFARSHETDWENGYENRLPVLSYERSPTVGRS